MNQMKMNEDDFNNDYNTFKRNKEWDLNQKVEREEKQKGKEGLGYLFIHFIFVKSREKNESKKGNCSHFSVIFPPHRPHHVGPSDHFFPLSVLIPPLLIPWNLAAHLQAWQHVGSFSDSC